MEVEKNSAEEQKGKIRASVGTLGNGVPRPFLAERYSRIVLP